MLSLLITILCKSYSLAPSFVLCYMEAEDLLSLKEQLGEAWEKIRENLGFLHLYFHLKSSFVLICCEVIPQMAIE